MDIHAFFAPSEINFHLLCLDQGPSNLIAGDCSFSSNPAIYLAMIFFAIPSAIPAPAWCNPKPIQDMLAIP